MVPQRTAFITHAAAAAALGIVIATAPPPDRKWRDAKPELPKPEPPKPENPSGSKYRKRKKRGKLLFRP